MGVQSVTRWIALLALLLALIALALFLADGA
jgi:hypothetical protein